MTTTQNFDLIVVGSGPGGYVAAIRAAQLGFNTAIVEKEKTLGGTCLNVGCIPSKALLYSSELVEKAKHQFDKHGISIGEVKVDLPKMIKRKRDVVTSITKGVEFLMGKNKITRFEGLGQFVDAKTILVKSNVGETTISAPRILIATGSQPMSLPNIPFDGKRVLSSTDALELQEIPKHLIVIGGGVIGVELGSVYARLGSKVSVVEFLDGLVPTMDRQLSATLTKSLGKAGFEFYFGHKVSKTEVTESGVNVTALDPSGKEIVLSGDRVLLSIGRRPFTTGLGLEKIGVKLDEKGRISVDENFQTTCAGVFAVGDVIPGVMLAHKASEEGVACVEKMAGHHPHINPKTIPNVVYTHPELASVGDTEEELKKSNRAYRTGIFQVRALGRARASEESEGFIKILADQNTDEILGVHIMSERASDLIAEAVVAMEYRASAEDIARMTHAHPTFSEGIKEAALAASGLGAIHA